MNEKALKILGGFFLLIVVMSICSKRNRTDSYMTQTRGDRYDVNVQTMVPASEGLDLKAVGSLLKEAETGKEFETLLNSPDNSVNNLDLDEDGKIDYIYVTEYGSEQVKGFSLTTQPTPGETQEIATIEVEKVSDSQAQVEIQGNEQIYGQNHYYRSSFGLTDFLIMSWLFSPRPLYASPWGYNSYPPNYAPRPTRPYSDYQRDMNRRTRGSAFSSASNSRVGSNVRSPNAGKAASTIKAPLKNPTASQRQFQARNPSQQVRSGGFGRSSQSQSTTRSSTVRRSAPSRSGGFSRGGK